MLRAFQREMRPNPMRRPSRLPPTIPTRLIWIVQRRPCNKKGRSFRTSLNPSADIGQVHLVAGEQRNVERQLLTCRYRYRAGLAAPVFDVTVLHCLFVESLLILLDHRFQERAELVVSLPIAHPHSKRTVRVVQAVLW